MSSLREDMNRTIWSNCSGFSICSSAYEGIGEVGLTNVRAIASGPKRSPMAVRFGPSVLPFSPIL